MNENDMAMTQSSLFISNVLNIVARRIFGDYQYDDLDDGYKLSNLWADMMPVYSGFEQTLKCCWLVEKDVEWSNWGATAIRKKQWKHDLAGILATLHPKYKDFAEQSYKQWKALRPEFFGGVDSLKGFVAAISDSPGSGGGGSGYARWRYFLMEGTDKVPRMASVHGMVVAWSIFVEILRKLVATKVHGEDILPEHPFVTLRRLIRDVCNFDMGNTPGIDGVKGGIVELDRLHNGSDGRVKYAVTTHVDRASKVLWQLNRGAFESESDAEIKKVCYKAMRGLKESAMKQGARGCWFDERNVVERELVRSFIRCSEKGGMVLFDDDVNEFKLTETDSVCLVWE